jgi:hypothetical protein
MTRALNMKLLLLLALLLALTSCQDPRRPLPLDALAGQVPDVPPIALILILSQLR